MVAIQIQPGDDPDEPRTLPSWPVGALVYVETPTDGGGLIRGTVDDVEMEGDAVVIPNDCCTKLPRELTL